MKIKKLLIAILCMLCVFSFSGCSRNVNTDPLSMGRYYNEKVTSTYSFSKTTYYSLSNFTGKSVNKDTLLLHKTLTFNATNWLYCMNIECVYFYVYANKDVNINQLTFTMTGLDGGEEDSRLNSKKVEEVVSVKAKKNKGVLVRVDIGHTVELDASSIVLSLGDEDLVTDSSFKWTIYGLQVYGDM